MSGPKAVQFVTQAQVDLFREAFQAVIRIHREHQLAMERLYASGRETRRHSAMHAAYHRKTARRNRRRP